MASFPKQSLLFPLKHIPIHKTKIVYKFTCFFPNVFFKTTNNIPATIFVIKVI